MGWMKSLFGKKKAESEDLRQFIEASMEGLRLQTASHQRLWNLGSESQWNVDLQQGQILWQFAEGVQVSASIQVVGTYNPQNGTFLWGWDHPSVPEVLSQHAALVKAYGQQNHVARFTTRQVQCTEDEAWEFTAVATRLGEASGAYRGNAGGTLVFLTFGEVHIQKS